MMKTILKVIFLSLFLISQPSVGAVEKEDPDVPTFFKNNPFSPENASTQLKGVRILSVDDKDFPNYLKTSQKKIITEVKKNGFLKTKNSKNAHVKRTIQNKKLEQSLNKASKQKFDQKVQLLISSLKLNMADLTNTPLKKSNLIDVEASGARQDSGWTGVSRLLEDEYFGTIILEEDDFSLYDGGVILTSELINVTINGNAGILIEERGPNNEPYTILQWANDHKSFVLKVAISASKDKPLRKLIKLAESLY